jgi:hypothetical protein
MHSLTLSTLHIMSVICRLFTLSHATILKPTAGGTGTTISDAQPNLNGSTYVQLSLSTCLIIAGLFGILFTLFLLFVFLFFYARGTRQPPHSSPELVWVMQNQKWLKRVMRLSPLPCQKRRAMHCRHPLRCYSSQSFSPFQKQGYSDSESLSRPQTRDQATQCGSIDQLQLSVRPVFPDPSLAAESSLSAGLSLAAEPSAKPSLSEPTLEVEHSLLTGPSLVTEPFCLAELSPVVESSTSIAPIVSESIVTIEPQSARPPFSPEITCSPLFFILSGTLDN